MFYINVINSPIHIFSYFFATVNTNLQVQELHHHSISFEFLSEMRYDCPLRYSPIVNTNYSIVFNKLA